MAIGEIKQFGAVQVTSGGNTFYVDKSSSGYMSYTGNQTFILNYTKIGSFTLVDSATDVKPLTWVEYSHSGKTCYISTDFVVGYIGYKDAVSEQKTVKIDNRTYKLSLMPVEFWTGLPSSVMPQLGTIMAWTTTPSTYSTDSQQVVEHEETSSEVSVYTREIDFSSWTAQFVPVLILDNSTPTINGTDADLGNKTAAFSVSYSVTDADSGQELTVKEKLNGTTISTIQNPEYNKTYTFTVTEETFASLTVGSTNTIEIEVTDGTATAYRRYTFTKTNSAPYITYTGSTDLGQLTAKPTITYQVSDDEGDEITVTEKLNGEVINTFTATGNTACTVDLTDTFWLTCGNGTNVLEITASDSLGGSNTKAITFSRLVNKVQIVMKEAIETDIAATKILVSPQWDTTGCTGTVEVCNNGFDDNLAWEDATTMVALSRPYVFTNATKAADKWGIKVRLTLVKNDGYEGEVAIYGFGGAYE